MAHKFDPVNINKLDNEWRKQNLPAVSTLGKLGLISTDILADIGCGVGYFTIPATEILDKKNKIFALDTSDIMLTEVEKRAIVANTSNVITIESKEYELILPDGTVTFALLAIVLHEIDDKKRFIEEILRILKPGGKLAIIEWEKKPTEIGPPLEHRIGKEEASKILIEMGFQIENVLSFADMFYGLVANKA